MELGLKATDFFVFSKWIYKNDGFKGLTWEFNRKDLLEALPRNSRARFWPTYRTLPGDTESIY